jgi:hypothetical protein
MKQPSLFRGAAIGCVSILIFYELVLRLLAPVVNKGQDQFTTNIIRLENYFDGRAHGNTVVIGSSLAARIPESALPAGWTNLSLAGDSALTGLEIVSSHNHLPKRVLIETNVLDRETNNDVVQKIKGFPRPFIRSVFWFERTAYAPVNIVVAEVEKSRKGANEAADNIPPDFTGQLKMKQRSFAEPPSAELLAKNFATLKALVRQLKIRGTDVSFFEMPEDRSLMELQNFLVRRAMVRKFASEEGLCWNQIDRGEQWHTTDGEHLLSTDAMRAGRRLGPGCGPGSRPERKGLVKSKAGS